MHARAASRCDDAIRICRFATDRRRRPIDSARCTTHACSLHDSARRSRAGESRRHRGMPVVAVPAWLCLLRRSPIRGGANRWICIIWLPACSCSGLATLGLMFAFVVGLREGVKETVMIWLTVARDAVAVRLPARGAAAPRVVLTAERRCSCHLALAAADRRHHRRRCRSRSACTWPGSWTAATAPPRWLRWLEAAPRHRAAELEAVRRRAAAVQHGDVRRSASSSWRCSRVCRSTRTARRCWPRRRSSTRLSRS